VGGRGALGIGAEATAPATDAGLVEFGMRVRFRHPLVRSVVYRSALPQERQEVHAALAEVTDPRQDPDRRAWHRATLRLDPMRTWRPNWCGELSARRQDPLIHRRLKLCLPSSANALLSAIPDLSHDRRTPQWPLPSVRSRTVVDARDAQCVLAVEVRELIYRNFACGTEPPRDALGHLNDRVGRDLDVGD
jgi:hypothetical protein